MNWITQRKCQKMKKTKTISNGTYKNLGSYEKNEQINNTYRQKGDPDQRHRKDFYQNHKRKLPESMQRNLYEDTRGIQNI